MDITDLLGEAVALVLMRFGDQSHVVIDMVVLGWTWHVELLLALVRRLVLLTTSTPCGDLGAASCTSLDNDRVWLPVVTWTWAIHFLRLKVRLVAERGVEATAISTFLCRRLSPIIKP